MKQNRMIHKFVKSYVKKFWNLKWIENIFYPLSEHLPGMYVKVEIILRFLEATIIWTAMKRRLWREKASLEVQSSTNMSKTRRECIPYVKECKPIDRIERLLAVITSDMEGKNPTKLAWRCYLVMKELMKGDFSVLTKPWWISSNFTILYHGAQT